MTGNDLNGTSRRKIERLRTFSFFARLYFGVTNGINVMTFKTCHATNIMANVKTFVNWHLRYNASIHTHIILSIWPSPNKKFFDYVRHVKKSHEHKKEYTRSHCNVLLWRWLTGFTYQSAAYLSCHLLFVEKTPSGLRCSWTAGSSYSPWRLVNTMSQ